LENQLHDILADYFGSVAQEQAELRAIQEEEEYERQGQRIWI
jgi:hypothetical protein